ncbi:MAG: SusD/RagB family nutrient-binding outer membrane lipoprotein [Bacteroides sp.]|nr:SusD/RagB family nutrient-binding outer membrane lipoprotein [Bacteroides sp.]MCI1681889.1 SusD/RagB family nutrient-binding outer membrane lipoprotein [Bacteroides sp.]
MKKKSKYTFIISCFMLIGGMLFSSCTGEFGKWNVNPNEATSEDLTHDNLNTGAYFSQMERGVFIVGKDMGGEYQITQALEGDLFASYFATITSWGYATYNNDNYVLYQGWYNAPFNDAYERIMSPWKSIYDVTDANSPARAMATIIKVLAMNRVTDMYGPIPYSKFGTAVQVAYDSQEDVYNQFFTELGDAIDVLTEYANNNSSAYLSDYDNVYSGNVSKWIKFANTLRLRLAMRVSYVDEAKAKEQASLAINNSYGLMLTSDDDATLHQSSSLTFYHPLWEIGTSWDDEHMSATMECYLNGYQDPRVAAYFKSTEETGVYKGARNGMSYITKANYQTVTSRPNFSQGDDMHWMYAAESYFLMAEANLRWGLGTGTAQSYYEQGIRTSFASQGVSGADSYINNTENLPLNAYTDPSNERTTDVSSMLSYLPVAWDETSGRETNLERIAIQKWIALYPDGQEAWSDMRRTGYPGWVRIQSYSFQSEVTDGEMISRLKFPTTEYSNNSENTQTAVKLLGGQDAAGTRLWWDTRR